MVHVAACSTSAASWTNTGDREGWLPEHSSVLDCAEAPSACCRGASCRACLLSETTVSTPWQAHISMGDIDLLHPPRELEQRRHKLKRLVQTPNSFFMDVKCPGCFNM